MKPVFSTFDFAYVVNLDDDQERMQRISRRLHKFNVPFERFPAMRPRTRNVQFRDPRVRPGVYACADSHAALLQVILDRGHESALIVEDDAVFRDDTGQLMEQIAPELAAERWDMFYMGLHLLESSGRVTGHLGRVGMGAHTHAYAVSRTAVLRLLNCVQQSLANPSETFDWFEDNSL